jgi:hypothetical protein
MAISSGSGSVVGFGPSLRLFYAILKFSRLNKLNLDFTQAVHSGMHQGLAYG